MAFNPPREPANTPRAPRNGRGAGAANEPRPQNQPRPVATASPEGDVEVRGRAARRDAEMPPAPKKTKPPREPRNWQFRSWLNWLNDRRFQLFLGFTLLAASLYLAAAFVSYMFTGHADQSVVEALDSQTVREAGAESRNLLGVLGASVADFFLRQWFGVASFALLPFVFFLGYRIVFRREPVSLLWMLGLCLFVTGWASVALGYTVVTRGPTDNPLPDWLSGAMGFEVAGWLKALLGFGTVLLLALLALSFVVAFFNVTTLYWAAPGWADARQRWADEREARREARAARAAAMAYDVEPSAAGTYEQEPMGVNHAFNPTAVMDDADDDLVDEDTGEVLHPNGPGADFSLINKGKARNGGQAADDAFEGNPFEPLTPPVVVPPVIVPPIAVPLPAPKPAGPSFAIERPQDEPVTAPVVAAASVPMTVSVPTPEPGRVIGDLDTEIPGLTDEAEDGALPELGNYDPTLDLSRYQYPTLDLLNDYGAPKVQVSKEELEANKDRIVETLGHYNIGIASIKATIGPTVTLYEIVPDAGVRISKIKNLEDDIALSLAALGIRIIAPIPGKGTIGIEVPNTRKEMVSMRSVLASDKFQNAEMDLPIAFGRTITNDIFIADLARMPHLLMAGATGQGKSVGLNVILTSLLYKRHPAQLKFVLVDPKKVELSLFNKIERHFLATLPGTEEAIITDTSKVVDTLNSLCIEMDNRYTLLKDAGVRNLKEYNKKFIERRLNPRQGHKFMPFIVVVIDELADLMMTAGKEVEQPIARLAQLARAIGIHLVVATQRPSVNVITGIIKANFPARISFKVTSKVDSRTILDTGGADQLIGQGDMLFSVGSDLIRVQCAFVDTPEVDRICDYIGGQQGYPTAYELPEYVGAGGGDGGGGSSEDMGERDAMFEEAARVIVTHQQGSTSLLQRRLKLGYNRAGRLIDQLEKAGIVGPFEGSKSRDVLIPDEYSLEQLLTKLADGAGKG